MPSLDFSQAWPWLQWVIAAAAILAFIGGGVRVIPSIWRFVTRTVNTINSLADLPDFIEKQEAFRQNTTATLRRQDEQIGQIHHEVNYNNGSSVKDAVARVEAGVAGLYDVTTAMKAEIDTKAPKRAPRTTKPKGEQ